MPTLVIWGEADVALDLICLDGTERYVQDLTDANACPASRTGCSSMRRSG